MMFRTQISAGVVLVGLLAGPPSLHAGSGRQKSFPGPGTDVETVGQVVVTQQAGTDLIVLGIVNPSNPSQAYPDAIIDVFSYPEGNFIAEGRAGCASDVGCYNADVVLQPQSSPRMLTVIVRGTPGSPPQTQVPLERTGWNGSSTTYRDLGSFDIAAGARIAPSGGLMAQTHVATVEERGGTNDSVLMVSVDDIPIAFDDNSGPAQMSFLCTPSNCPDGLCTVLPARRSNKLSGTPPASDPTRFDVPKPGPVTVVWDEGAHNHRADQDKDGLGDDLEVFLGTCDPNIPGKDTDGDGKPDCADEDVDGDGVPDAYEVLGISDNPNDQNTTVSLVKLPYYGADPLKKDLFVEMVWAPACQGSDPTKCDRHPKPPSTAKDKDAWEWTSTIALDYAKKFPPDLAVHVDIGPNGDDPLCRDTCGNWGAQRLADNADYHHATCEDSAFCEGFGNARRGVFYHAIAASDRPCTCSCSVVDSRPGTAAHEAGHYFGLNHWGEWSGKTSSKVNCKPNYVSIMNYAYSDNPRFGQGAAFPGFSQGRFLAATTGHGDVVLNPTAVDEATGLWPFGNFDPVADAPVLDLVNNVFGTTVDPSSGGIDWDMDGKVQPSGAQARAFIDRNGDCDPGPPAGDSASLIAFLPGAPVGLNPSVASSLSGSGLALFVTGNCSPGLFCTTALLRTVSPCTDSDDNPCRSWQNWQSLGQTVDGVASMTAAGNIAVYEDQVGHLLHYMALSPAGVAVGGKVGGPAVAGPPTAIVTPTGGVQVYAAVTTTSGGVSSTNLRMWEYDPANDSWAITGAIQRWPNGVPVEMVPGTAIGAALGYRSDVTDAGGVPVERLFAAIPSKNSATGAAELELATTQKEVLTVPFLGFSLSLPYYVWTPLPDQIWAWRNGKPTADIGRVGLAFRPEDPVVSSAPHAGRFYVTWQTKDGSRTRSYVSFTRGNVLPLSGTAPASTVQGLVFVGDTVFYNWDANWPKGVGLVYAGGHVRGVGADEGFISRYFPHVDGIFESQQRDHDDYTQIMSKLACALTQCGSLHQ